MRVKPAWNELAGADRIIHHLQWLYPQAGGTNTGSTWIEDRKRRQAWPHMGLRRLWTCTPDRSEWFPGSRSNTCTRIPRQVNHPLRGQPASGLCGLSMKRWQGRTWAEFGEKRRAPPGKWRGSTWKTKRGTTKPLLPPKDNPSNQYSGCELTAACLEGRVSRSRHPFAMNWFYWLVYTIQTKCERP